MGLKLFGFVLVLCGLSTEMIMAVIHGVGKWLIVN